MELMENGYLAKPTHGDKIRFAPPLVINREQILETIRSFVKVSLLFLNSLPTEKDERRKITEFSGRNH